MHALVSAESAQSLLDAHLAALNGIPAAGGDFRALKESGNEFVITVHADYFLCHILIAFHVIAVSGDLKGKHTLTVLLTDRRLHVEVVHDADDVLIRNGNAENTADLVDLDGHFAGLYTVSSVHIEVCGGNLAAAELLDKVQGALHSHNGRILVDTLFIARARVCALADAS